MAAVIAKKQNIEPLTCNAIATVELWLNNYPRRIINFNSPNRLFNNALAQIAA